MSRDERPGVRVPDATVIAETAKAILVQAPDLADCDEANDQGAVWIPQSQVHDDSEVYKKGDTGVLVLKAWLAQQLGLEP